MLARLSAFVIWALVAATAVFWGLRLFVHAPSAPSYAVAVGETAEVRSDLTRLLGAAPVNGPVATATPEARSRFRLLGIVAPKYAQSGEARPVHGVALIAIDGKMPKAFAVGAPVDGDLVLQSVSLRTVSIASGQGAPTITLELPPPASAATGTLPGAVVGGLPGPTGPMPVPPFIPQPVPQAPMPQAMQPMPPPGLVPATPAVSPQPRPDPNTPNQ